MGIAAKFARHINKCCFETALLERHRICGRVGQGHLQMKKAKKASAAAAAAAAAEAAAAAATTKGPKKSGAPKYRGEVASPAGVVAQQQ